MLDSSHHVCPEDSYRQLLSSLTSLSSLERLQTVPEVRKMSCRTFNLHIVLLLVAFTNSFRSLSPALLGVSRRVLVGTSRPGIRADLGRLSGQQWESSRHAMRHRICSSECTRSQAKRKFAPNTREATPVRSICTHSECYHHDFDLSAILFATNSQQLCRYAKAAMPRA